MHSKTLTTSSIQNVSVSFALTHNKHTTQKSQSTINTNYLNHQNLKLFIAQQPVWAHQKTKSTYKAFNGTWKNSPLNVKHYLTFPFLTHLSCKRVNCLFTFVSKMVNLNFISTHYLHSPKAIASTHKASPIRSTHWSRSLRKERL
jgi:hypothetical protein